MAKKKSEAMEMVMEGAEWVLIAGGVAWGSATLGFDLIGALGGLGPYVTGIVGVSALVVLWGKLMGDK